MITGKLKPTTIDDYIATERREDVQEKLWLMVDCIRNAAPGAEESLKWGMPAFSYKRILVTFKAYKNHIGFYPTPSAVTAFAKKLAKYTTANASIQLPLNEPLPFDLITEIVKYRVKENLEKDKKWKS